MTREGSGSYVNTALLFVTLNGGDGFLWWMLIEGIGISGGRCYYRGVGYLSAPRRQMGPSGILQNKDLKRKIPKRIYA